MKLQPLKRTNRSAPLSRPALSRCADGPADPLRTDQRISMSLQPALIHATPSPTEVAHLPAAPTDEEKYRYFDPKRRWPFLWLFVSQALLVIAFIYVMRHSVATTLGMTLLTFTIPPLVVNLWLRMRKHRISLNEHLGR